MPRRLERPSMAFASLLALLGAISLTFHLFATLGHREAATSLVSEGLWRDVVASCGGTIRNPVIQPIVEIPMIPVVLVAIAWSGGSWIIGAVALSWFRRLGFLTALGQWGRIGSWWWLGGFAWELVGLVSDVAGKSSLSALLRALLPFFESAMLAGWLATLAAQVSVARPTGDVIQSPKYPAGVWIGAAIYFGIFSTMNWMLYEALNLPHGDSAMYEEHVWNLLHGQGFRSYLDNGRLFLGEHIQVIHLGVIPVYWLWPSHLLLELCQSGWLAAGAFPAYSIALRHSGHRRAATLIALAYLLYFPMQFLDIAVTYKTFRPNSFEIPFLLFAINALERNRMKSLLVWLSLALLCQEDAATVIAPLGLWIAIRHCRTQNVLDRVERRRWFLLGSGLALFGVAYVAFVVKVALPWFRGGEDVHFSQYFNEFGSSSNAIVASFFSHPLPFLAKLAGPKSWLFLAGLLAPLGCIPFFSPGRLATAAPLFGVLCLSNLTNTPLHHFHAPLVPILIWSAAAGTPAAARCWNRISTWIDRRDQDDAEFRRRRIPFERFIPTGKLLGPSAANHKTAHLQGHFEGEGWTFAVTIWIFGQALLTGIFFSVSPLGIGFWDPHSEKYWKDHYVVTQRARMFRLVEEQIPIESRVASTDYVHTRLTHRDRSYDYSDYRPNVPKDTDYIVIDTRHPYSKIKSPHEVKEYSQHPDLWELLDDRTDGYFIILKRRR